MTRLIAISVLTLLLTACALPPQGGGRHAIGGAAPAGAPHPAIDVSPAVRLDLAPGGRLKAAINFGNPILAQRDPATGEPRGVSVDLARELGRRLGVPVDLVLFDSAGRVSAAARSAPAAIRLELSSGPAHRRLATPERAWVVPAGRSYLSSSSVDVMSTEGSCTPEPRMHTG